MAKNLKSKSKVEPNGPTTSSRAVETIVQKLWRIQLDVLFDLVGAKRKWMETRNLLARQAAEHWR